MWVECVTCQFPSWTFSKLACTHDFHLFLNNGFEESKGKQEAAKFYFQTGESTTNTSTPFWVLAPFEYLCAKSEIKQQSDFFEGSFKLRNDAVFEQTDAVLK